MTAPTALSEEQVRLLRAVAARGSAVAAGEFLGLTVEQVARELTAIRARLGVSSTAAAVATLEPEHGQPGSEGRT